MHKHICKNKCKHMHKILHITHHAHHHLMHWWELLFIFALWFFGFMSANITWNIQDNYTTDHIVVAENFLAAQKKWWPSTSDSNIITMRPVNSNVENSFYPWYCTYWAALISPEFFPFIETNKQQRTWWGNAIDRCENALATWYKIGSTPSVWSLIVYWKSTFGHVGKVMFNNTKNWKIIVRDMNRVSKFIMTDRREDTNDSSIKCYIYPKKTTPIETTPIIVTPPIETKPIEEVIIVTPPVDNTNSTTNTTTSNTTKPTTTITTPIENKPTEEVIIVTPSIPQSENKPIILEQEKEIEIVPTIINPISNIGNIELDFTKVSDIAKHFIAQRYIWADILNKTIKVWEKTQLILSIKNDSWTKNYEWLLKAPFEIIASNNNIEIDYTLIWLVKNGKVEINIDWLQTWESTIIIKFWWEKIGKINMIIN